MKLSINTLKALVHATTAEDNRFTLSAVHVSVKRVINLYPDPHVNGRTIYTATDGHTLIQVDCGETASDDTVDLPVPVLISADMIKRLKVRDYTTLDNGIVTSDGRTEPVSGAENYPSVTGVVASAAKNTTVVRLGLTPDVLLKLAKATKALKMPEIIVEIAEPLDPIRISGTDGDGHPVSGLLMPRRLEDKT